MVTTVPTARRLDAQRGTHELREAVAAPRAPVPPFVPDEVAAEHPDAATVVAGRRPQGGVRVVDRGRRHRSPGPVVALAVCAMVAALTAPAGGAARPGASMAPAAPVVVTVGDEAPSSPAGVGGELSCLPLLQISGPLRDCRLGR